MFKPFAAFHKGIFADYHAKFDPRDMNPRRPLEVAFSDDEVSFRVGPFTLDCWPAEGHLGEALGKLVGNPKNTSDQPVEGA